MPRRRQNPTSGSSSSSSSTEFPPELQLPPELLAFLEAEAMDFGGEAPIFFEQEDEELQQDFVEFMQQEFMRQMATQNPLEMMANALSLLPEEELLRELSTKLSMTEEQALSPLIAQLQSLPKGSATAKMLELNLVAMRADIAQVGVKDYGLACFGLLMKSMGKEALANRIFNLSSGVRLAKRLAEKNTQLLSGMTTQEAFAELQSNMSSFNAMAPIDDSRAQRRIERANAKRLKEMGVEKQESILRTAAALIKAHLPPESLKNDQIVEELGIQDIPEEYLCSITQSIITDPVWVKGSDCPARFERNAILKWLETEDTHPLTRESLSKSDLLGDKELKKKIANYLKEEKRKQACAGKEEVGEKEEASTSSEKKEAVVSETPNAAPSVLHHYGLRKRKATNEPINDAAQGSEKKAKRPSK